MSINAKSKYEADLHCHSTASDGLLRPSKIVELAGHKGLKALALTDHDTIDGWEEAEKAAGMAGISFIKGIEINTDWKGKEVHILGYGMASENTIFRNHLLELQEKRITRIKEILLKLKKLGMDISFEEVAQYINGKSAGRPHVAQAMVEKGYVNSFKEAFHDYLSIGSPAYVPRYKLDPGEAIRIIRDSGGIAVLAHPGAKGIETEIGKWVEKGLQGIEIIHPDHTASDTKRYRKMTQKYNLLATGGSDFHGPGIKPGIDLGDWGVGYNVVEQLLAML